LVDVAQNLYCPFCDYPKIVFDGKTCFSCRRTKSLQGLFFAASYKDFITKKLISQFKYPPYIKDVSKNLVSLIINYFHNLDKIPDFHSFFLLPIPLEKRRLKKRGFNQAEEIAIHLAQFLEKPVLTDVLIKIKPTLDQVGLTKEEREENIKGAYLCQKPDLAKNRKILLIDDIFTTGSTMEEAASTLKKSGAREVWGLAVARG